MSILRQGENDLETTNPDFLSEWDFDANFEDGGLIPANISTYSSRKVHWICPKGHHYMMSPADKMRGCGCNICRNLKDELCLKKIKETINNMRIDVVIGNPPYQDDNSQNGRQTKPLYDKFIDMGIRTTDRVLTFITNNTFLTNDSKKELRDQMIQAGLNRLDNYPISGDVFTGVSVSACVFNIDKLDKSRQFIYKRIENNVVVNEYKTEINQGDIIVESPYELSIPRKTASNKNMGQIVLGDKLFGIASSGKIGFSGKGEYIEYSVLDFDNSVKLKNKFDGVEDIAYMKEDDVPKGNEYINYYKVICPLIISKSSLNSFNKAEILEPRYICTQNWSTLGAFIDREQAENLTKYLKTKLFQFIAYVFCSNAMTSISKIVMEHIPQQDFSNSSRSIDWSQPINISCTPAEIFADKDKPLNERKDKSIDAQLYIKYGLSEDEISYIEKTI